VENTDSHSSKLIHTDVNALVRLRHDARGFSFLPRQPVQSLLSGRKRSRLRGRGLDFEELRHYRPGDDIRTMDWRVTNRTGKPHVRVYTEERDRTVLLLVDQRLSMFFGSQQRMKSVTAAEAAALTAWRTLDVGDRVGAILFNDSDIVELRPARGERSLLAMLSRLCGMNQQLTVAGEATGQPGQLPRVLEIAERIAGHDALVVIISDFDGWDDKALASVKRLAQHNDLIASYIFDPLESDISSASNLVVSDGHYQLQLDPDTGSLADRFQRSFNTSVEGLQQELRKHGMPVLPVDTISPVFQQLRRHLGQH
jgi:uncharacterized protein (DUF58 family)